MSEDILGRLNELCGAVRARVEATADFKTMLALERAISEVKGLMPQTAEASTPVEAVSEEEPVAAPVEACAVAEIVEVSIPSEEPAGEAETISAEAETPVEAGAANEEIVTEAAPSEVPAQQVVEEEATISACGDEAQPTVSTDAPADAAATEAAAEATASTPEASADISADNQVLAEGLAPLPAAEPTAPSTPTLN